MSKLSLSGRDGRQITDWRSWTRPKAEYHWRAGRSAMELARSWFTSPVPVCPPEVRSLLKSQPETAGLVLIEGWPEFATALPERGEGRNHDLLLWGSLAGSGVIVSRYCLTLLSHVIVSVEAKVDEEYGKCIGEYWYSARNSGKKTRAPQRIEALLSMVFGANARPDTQP